jgi:hypothetical protein
MRRASVPARRAASSRGIDADATDAPCRASARCGLAAPAAVTLSRNCCHVAKKTSFPKQDIRVLLLEGVSQTAVEVFSAAGYSQIERTPRRCPRTN